MPTHALVGRFGRAPRRFASNGCYRSGTRDRHPRLVDLAANEILFDYARSSGR